MPQNVSDLRSSLGLTNDSRKFVQGHADLLRPLTDLLCKDVAFAWSADYLKAFEGVKMAFTTSPVLFMPDHTKLFEMVADACGFDIRAALLPDSCPMAYLCRMSVLLNVPMVLMSRNR